MPLPSLAALCRHKLQHPSGCRYACWCVELIISFCRPGRLDKLLYVPLPGPEARVAILRTQTMRTPLAPDVDLQSIGQSPRVQGFSGADLAALAREAAVLSLKVPVTHKGSHCGMVVQLTPLPLLGSSAAATLLRVRGMVFPVGVVPVYWILYRKGIVSVAKSENSGVPICLKPDGASSQYSLLAWCMQTLGFGNLSSCELSDSSCQCRRP